MTARQVFSGELVGLTLLAVSYALLLAEPLPIAIVEAANVIGPALLMAILGIGVLYSFGRLPYPIMAPAVWFRIAVAVYFGIGAIFAALVTGEVRDYLRALYPFDAEMLLRLNLLNAVGTLAALIGIASGDRLLSAFASGRSVRALHAMVPGSRGMLAKGAASPPSPRRGQTRFYGETAPNWLEQPRTIRIGMLWLCIGLPWRILVDLPNAFGLFEVVVPGVFNLLGLARLAGYAMVLATRSGRWANIRLLTWLIWAADLSLGLASFAKTDTLLLGFAIVLSLALGGARPRMLGLALMALFALYAAVRPIVDFGRERVFERYGSLLGAGLEERMGYVVDALAGARARQMFAAETSSWAWLLRFSYANAQAFVVSRYDEGNPGDTGSAEYLLTILVPRIVWADKPIVSHVGRDLYNLVTGAEGTSIAAGVFAEAYWNGGWLSVAIWSSYVGMIIALLTSLTSKILTEGRPLQIPFVLSAMVLAARIDGWFGMTYVGGAALLFLLFFLTSVVERYTAFRRAPRWQRPSMRWT